MSHATSIFFLEIQHVSTINPDPANVENKVST